MARKNKKAKEIKEEIINIEESPMVLESPMVSEDPIKEDPIKEEVQAEEKDPKRVLPKAKTDGSFMRPFIK